MRYSFEWDPVKGKENLRRHKISFERAAEFFLDPLAVSVLDPEHSEAEERWVTIGRDSHGTVLVLVHTFLEASAEERKNGESASFRRGKPPSETSGNMRRLIDEEGM